MFQEGGKVFCDGGVVSDTPPHWPFILGVRQLDGEAVRLERHGVETAHGHEAEAPLRVQPRQLDAKLKRGVGCVASLRERTPTMAIAGLA